MSDYLFKRAKVGDLLRLEGPLGTFFYRNNEICERVIFLATGTGIAPIKSILDNFEFKPTAHFNYESTILPIKDGLPKFKDFPKDFGGSGILLEE